MYIHCSVIFLYWYILVYHMAIAYSIVTNWNMIINILECVFTSFSLYNCLKIVIFQCLLCCNRCMACGFSLFNLLQRHVLIWYWNQCRTWKLLTITLYKYIQCVAINVYCRKSRNYNYKKWKDYDYISLFPYFCTFELKFIHWYMYKCMMIENEWVGLQSSVFDTSIYHRNKWCGQESRSC